MKEKCLMLLQCFVFIVILSGCVKKETQDAKEGGAIRSLPLQFAEKACSDMPDGLITYYDDLPDSIIEAEEKCQFTYLSMEAVIRNREIVQLIRNWVP